MFTNDKNTASSLLDNGFSSDSAFASFLIPSASYAFDDTFPILGAFGTAPGTVAAGTELSRTGGTGGVTARCGTAATSKIQTAAAPFVFDTARGSTAAGVMLSGGQDTAARPRPVPIAQ